MHKMEIGTPICHEPLIAVSEIKNITPARYNGIEEQYVACAPNQAQCYIITTHDEENILITSDCKNKELLIDIV